MGETGVGGQAGAGVLSGDSQALKMLARPRPLHTLPCAPPFLPALFLLCLPVLLHPNHFPKCP